MNPSTGEIKEFSGKPTDGWVEIKVGGPVTFKGCHFRIHRINPAANQIILVGISTQEYNEIVLRKAVFS